NLGTLDLFTNTGSNAKNVERADFIFSTGVTAPSDAELLASSGHIVAEKSGNNPVKIAAILALDGNGQPSQYGPLIKVNSNNADVEYGLTNIQATLDFLTNTSANPGYIQKNEYSTETMGMAFVSLADLGVSAGQTYYGFSLFPNDVNQTYDLTQPATFPQDTGGPDEADLYGGAAGYFTLATTRNIQGIVFQDNDGDGSLNGTDAGLPDVSVTLYADTNNDGAYSPGTDQPVGVSVVSGPDGSYAFDVTADGDYFALADDADTDIPTGLSLPAQANPVKVSVAGGNVSDVNFPFAPAEGGNDPVATNDSATTSQDQAVVIDVLANDTPANASFTLAIDTQAQHGVATIASGKISYAPDVGYTGSDSFIYRITDAANKSAQATVTVQITPAADFDGDGVSDALDIDDDNDGILDSVEGSGDFDGDGKPNSRDLDADGDGITDLQESGLDEARQASLDSNGDGEIDSGFGANGLADGVETGSESGAPEYSGNGSVTSPVDSDDDGQPDFLDLDADNDGIPDVIEAGKQDSNGDGKADSGQVPTNAPLDSDNSGKPDYIDLDSDNDGILDLLEAGGDDSDHNGRVDGFTDANSDGYDDNLAAKPLAAPDTDSDGLRDFRDLDSDNDGLTDLVEAGGDDADHNGVVDSFSDDGDNGYQDALASAPLPVPDSDGDNIADFRDLDSDNDGLADLVEGTQGNDADSDGNGRVDDFKDDNQDGLDDGVAASPLARPDTDGDSHPDYLDADTDNDGISDLIEAGGADSDFNGVVDHFTDANGDGMDDPLNTASSGKALPNPDTDGDGLADFRDLDSDGDGASDINEAGLNDSDGDGKIDDFTDADGDGLDDNAQAVLGAAGLKDRDGNGVADFLQTCDCGTEPAFRSGLQGSGAGSFGPGLLALLGGAAWIRRRRAAGLALLLAAPGLSLADNSPADRDFDSRVYLGVGAGVTQLQPEPGCGCYRVEDDTSAGGQIFAGVDISRTFTLEGYYADLGGADVGRVTGGSAGSVDYQVYGLSAIGYLLNSRGGDDYASGYDDEGKFRREGLSIYGRIGVGAMENEAKVSYERVENVHMHLGAGVEYGWENGVAARAEYTSYDRDAQMLSLALLKRFGEVEEAPAREVNVPKPKVVATPVAPRAPVSVDADHDGVPNARDICPKTAPGVIVNDLGCAVDRDNDGVLNDADECPNTPANVKVDEKGCPPKPLGRGFTGVLKGVNFLFNSDKLTTRARHILDDVATILNRYPQVKVLIVGHTDNLGTPAFNKDLSIRRAKAVARYLVTQGVFAKRLRYAGRGEARPIASNDTEEGRAKNRRVEFVIQ
ncbi:MAG TPA: hypothetical protein ENK26_12555, partial [Gammaproteobacteria bacterium]|nr:hypothetical protein [Gammaproteobacteria bacterium]